MSATSPAAIQAVFGSYTGVGPERYTGNARVDRLHAGPADLAAILSANPDRADQVVRAYQELVEVSVTGRLDPRHLMVLLGDDEATNGHPIGRVGVFFRRWLLDIPAPEKHGWPQGVSRLIAACVQHVFAEVAA